MSQCVKSNRFVHGILIDIIFSPSVRKIERAGVLETTMETATEVALSVARARDLSLPKRRLHAS